MKQNLKVQEIQIQNLTQRTISVLGGKGCGKSTLIRMMGRELASQRLPVIIIDPIGGKSIRDGTFVDLKITQPLNNEVLTWLNEQWHNKKVILIDAEALNRDEFVEWCEIFFKQKWRNGLIIIDEVHNIIPQQRGKYCLSFESFSKKCRNDNCGLILSSQRPQSVNKETLALSDIFIIGRTMYIRDREIIVTLARPFIKAEQVDDFEQKVQSLNFLQFIIIDYRGEES